MPVSTVPGIVSGGSRCYPLAAVTLFYGDPDVVKRFIYYTLRGVLAKNRLGKKAAILLNLSGCFSRIF
jgi:hypothetical protein